MVGRFEQRRSSHTLQTIFVPGRVPTVLVSVMNPGPMGLGGWGIWTSWGSDDRSTRYCKLEPEPHSPSERPPPLQSQLCPLMLDWSASLIPTLLRHRGPSFDVPYRFFDDRPGTPVLDFSFLPRRSLLRPWSPSWS